MISNPPSDLLDVLVIDDEQPALDELVYLLERDPRVATVRGCDSAAEALRLLQESDVDAVFLDVQMPGLTGLDLAQVLSRFKEPPPVVPEPVGDLTGREWFALGSLALLCLLLGLLPQPVLDTLRWDVRQLTIIGDAARVRVGG